MKLRNKRTGEIADSAFVRANGSIDDGSLAELNDEWEDYQEPNWYINVTGEVLQNNKGYCNVITPEKLKVIGNHFETREEAEKVREKLKAITRLSKCGFKFEGYADKDRANGGDIVIYAHVDIPHNNLLEEAQPAMLHDLDLLFGGGE